MASVRCYCSGGGTGTGAGAGLSIIIIMMITQAAPCNVLDHKQLAVVKTEAIRLKRAALKLAAS